MGQRPGLPPEARPIRTIRKSLREPTADQVKRPGLSHKSLAARAAPWASRNLTTGLIEDGD